MNSIEAACVPLPTKTTVGQLVYPALPGFNFARLVSDLDSALTGNASEGRRLIWDHEDIALLDVGSSRIGLCLADGLGSDGMAVVTITVGYGTEPGQNTRLAERQAMLARLIADRIAARFLPQETIWTQCEEVATPDLFDRLNHGLSARDDRGNAPAKARKQRRIGPEAQERFAEPTEIPRLLARLEATLAARKSGRPDPEPGSMIPVSDEASLLAARAALYNPANVEAPPPSAMMRLAAFALNATLMLVVLPVGAAMMTYSLIRGADVNTSARMLALGGMAAGLASPFHGSSLVQSLMIGLV